MKRTSKVIVNALVMSISMTALSSTLSATEQSASLPPFYRSLQELKAGAMLGKVIKQEKIATTIPNAIAWRIAYNSSDLFDRPTISTALVVAPAGGPPKKGRPIIAWAHGTTGTAQNCGPSQVENPAQPLSQYFLVNGNSWTDYGIPGVNVFIDKGYILVATDYQGLGGGGKHQYVIAKTQGRDVINSLRAVASMKIGGDANKSIIYGWSQGGGAVLAAAGMPEYLSRNGTAEDQIKIAGFVAMAPQDLAVLAADSSLNSETADKMLNSLIALFTDNVFNFSHLSMNLWANSVAFPELKLTDIFTEEGAKLIDTLMQNKCVHVLSDTLNFTLGKNFKSLLKPKPDNTLSWAKAMMEGSAPSEKPVAPVVIYWGDKDTVVPPAMGKAYRDKMCALGANISRIKLPGEQNHFTTPSAALPLYLKWISDRIDGAGVENGCHSGDKDQ